MAFHQVCEKSSYNSLEPAEFLRFSGGKYDYTSNSVSVKWKLPQIYIRWRWNYIVFVLDISISNSVSEKYLKGTNCQFALGLTPTEAKQTTGVP